MPTDRHRPRKRFGQHFLAPPWAAKLVAAIAPGPGETFLEIGPGEAALTRPLAGRAGKVVAVEIDRDLAASLRDAAIPNVTVLEGDFLSVDEARLRAALGPGTVRVAANLPYNVASPILFRLAALAPALGLIDATVMVQREVADRLVASPGSRDYGVLTILLGRRASISRVFTLPPGAFRPAPKVHSAVVRLQFHEPAPAAADEPFFEEVVQAAFTRRRKTLANALLAIAALGAPRHDSARPPARETQHREAGGAPHDDREPQAMIANALTRIGLSPVRRPETLSIAEWVALADALGAALPRRG